MLKESILLSAHRMAKSVSQLVITMLLARILSVSEMGIYQQILIIVIALGSFVPFELPTSFSYFYNKTDDRKQKMRAITNTGMTLMGLGGLSYLIITLIYGTDFVSSRSPISEYTAWMGLWCLAMIAGSYLENLYVSTKQAKVFSLFTLTYYIVYFATVVAVTLVSRDLLLIVMMTAILEASRVLLLHILFHIRSPIRLEPDWKLLKQQLKYTVAVGAVTAINVVTLYTDKVLVNIFFTLEEFALFSIASKEIPFVYTITVSVITAMLPKLSHMYNVQKNPEQALQLWRNTSKALAVIIFSIFWVLLFYHREYLELIYSQRYISGAPILMIYLMKFPLSFTIYYTLLLISGHQKMVLKNAVIVVLLNLILSLTLMIFFGYFGIAVATVLVSYTGIYLQQKDVCRVYEVRQRDLLPYGMIFKSFLMSGFVTAIVFLSLYLMPLHHLIAFVIGSVLAVGLSLVLAFYFKDLEIAPLKKLLQRKEAS